MCGSHIMGNLAGPRVIEVPFSGQPSSLQLLRFLARTGKMPVQNSKSKISARLDLATQLLQICRPTTFNSQLCQKGHFTLQAFPEGCLLEKDFVTIPQNVKFENSSLNSLPVHKGGFQEIACPKDRLDGSWQLLSTWISEMVRF